MIRSDSSGPVTPRFPRFQSFKFQWPKILLAPLTLVAVATYTPRALAQSPPTPMLSAGVSENVNNVDVCNACPPQVQEQINAADDQFDVTTANNSSSVRAENLSHEEADQAIERLPDTGQQKQVLLANEEDRHNYTLAELARALALAAAEHAQQLAQIMAQAGQALGNLTSTTVPSSPGAGNPSAGGGSPPPGSAGAPNSGANPPAAGSPPGGGNPANPQTAGGTLRNGSPGTTLGSNPSGNPAINSPPSGAGGPGTVSAPGGATNPVNGGQPNSGTNDTSPGGPNNSPQSPASPATAASNPSGQPGILKD
ncbi:MAG: hypothetical protein WBY93_02575 [Candidatus Binatus sp.]